MMAIWPFSLVKGSTPSPKTNMPMSNSNLPSHNRTAKRSADVQHLAVTPLERKSSNLSVTKETASQPRFVVNTEARLKRYTVHFKKKGYRFSRPQPGFHLPNSPWPGKNSLVSDIPAGDGKIANFFLQCMYTQTCIEFFSILRSLGTSNYLYVLDYGIFVKNVGFSIRIPVLRKFNKPVSCPVLTKRQFIAIRFCYPVLFRSQSFYRDK
jgi:hypothetical protein